MPGKMRECDGCHKMMRSDNLKNHMRNCKGLNQNLEMLNEYIQHQFTNMNPVSKPQNLKIAELVIAIVDESSEKIQRKDLPENNAENERQDTTSMGSDDGVEESSIDMSDGDVTDEESDDEDGDDYEDDDDDDDDEDDDINELSDFRLNIAC